MQLFRYLDVEAHANDFMAGKVMVSTLERCRHAEGARADPGEALHTYHANRLAGFTDDPEVQRQLARTPFAPRGRGEVNISGISFSREIQNAYVFCSALRPSEKLERDCGPYCIRIANAEAFFKAISHALVKETWITEGVAGIVEYGPREADIAASEDIGDVGFKKPESYRGEFEFRMLWIPRQPKGIDRLLVTAPEVPALCERIR